MMKVLQVNKFYYLRAGAERYFFELSKLLEGAGHEVIPFAMEHGENLPSIYSKFFVSEAHFDRKEGFKKDIKKVGRMMYSLEAKRKLEELILHERPDIAHIHNIYHQISPSILDTLKKHNIPVIMSLHDYKLVCPNYKLYTEGSPCERCRKHRYYNAMLHNCLGGSAANFAGMAEMYLHHSLLRGYERKVDYFISPSLFLKELCEHWGWPARKIIHMPYFVDAADMAGEESEPGNYVLYFGRLSVEKGLDTLLHAAKKLPEIKFKLAGSGPLAAGFEQMARRHEIGNVEFLPHKYGGDLWDVVRRAKVVVLPSVWYENYPFSLLEAQIFGKPIIASRIGGIPEIVHDKKNGRFFEPGNADDLAHKIRTLYADDERCRGYGFAARERVRRENNPAKHLEEILKLYEWAISRKSKKS